MFPASILAIALLTSARGAAGDTAPRPAPAFTLPTLAGTVSLDSLRGRPVYVDFWASWCGPCRKSFPWMNDLQKRFGPRGLVVVAINLDKDRRPAEAFLREMSPAFTVAFDPAGRTAEAYGVPAMPSSFLVDAAGRIVATHAGFDSRKTAEIETRIQEVLTR